MPQSYVALYYHYVIGTKDRESLIHPEWQDRLFAYIGGILRENKCVLLKSGGVEDHAHFLISAHQDCAPSTLARVLKSNSSRWLHETLKSASNFAWQNGYSAFTVSPGNLDGVKAYIANQAEHHRRMTFKEELIDLYRKAGIEFDERYLLD